VIRRIAGAALIVLVASACTGGPADPPEPSRSATASASPGQPSTTVFDIGGYPNGIAFADGWLWVADPEVSELLRIDPRDGSITERFPAGEGSFLIARSGGDLWISDHLAGTVSRVDPATGRRIERFRLGRFPTIVLDRGDSVVAVAGDGTVFRLPPGDTPRPILRLRAELESLTFAWGSLWVTEYGSHEIRRFDPVDGTELDGIQLETSAWILAFAQDRLWVTNRDEGTVTAIGPDGEIAATVDLPDLASPFGIEELGGRLWVADAEGGRLYEIDPATAALVATYELPSPAFALAHDGEHLWVTAGDSGALIRIDAPEPVLPFEGDATPLAAGRYTYDGFDPPLSFAIGPGWAGGHMSPVYFDVAQLEGRSFEIAVGFMHPDTVIGSEGERPAEDLSPKAALGILASNPAVEPGPITARTIDGYEAYELELDTERGAELFGSADGGNFVPDPGRHRFLALEVDDALLVIVELIHRRPRAEAERLTEEVVDSVLIGSDPAG
jgi:streptogramin lyase